jgi:hypothetical protein
MICPRCAGASDWQAGRDQHCRDVGCTCGHRVERGGDAAKPPTGALRGRAQ